MERREAESRYLSIVIPAIVLAVTLCIAVKYKPHSFLVRDASFYATTTRGLVTSFSLDQRRLQPESWYTGSHPGYKNLDLSWSNISVGIDGTLYPKHSIVMPLFAAPFYAAFGAAGLLVFNALCVIIMLSAAYVLAVRFAPPVAAIVAVMLCALCPAVQEHTYHFSFDMFTAALVALGAAALLRPRPIVAGLLLGTAIWARPQLALLVFPLAVGGLWRRAGRRELLAFAASLAVPVGVAAWLNTLMFGAPWITSYERVLTVVDRTPGLKSHCDLWTLSTKDGLERLFMSRDHGLLFRSPASLVGVVGLASLWRRSRPLALALALSVAGFVLFFLRYKYTTARFFFPWQALLCLPLALFLTDLCPGPARGLRIVRELLRKRSGSKLLVWGVVGAVGAALLAIFIISRTATSDRYVLADHIAEAKVFRNDLACDYFNMRYHRWECSQVEDDPWEWTGLALGADECVFDDEKKQLLWLHPPSGGATKRILFEGVPPRGVLKLRYGLADTAVSKKTCFSVVYGDVGPIDLCADKAGELKTYKLEVPPATSPTSVEFRVRSPSPGKRHLCVGGTIVDEGTL